jgi:hypothetical protein
LALLGNLGKKDKVDGRGSIETISVDRFHTLLNFGGKSPIELGSTFQESSPHSTKNRMQTGAESLELLGKSCKM